MFFVNRFVATATIIRGRRTRLLELVLYLTSAFTGCSRPSRFADRGDVVLGKRRACKRKKVTRSSSWRRAKYSRRQPAGGILAGLAFLNVRGTDDANWSSMP